MKCKKIGTGYGANNIQWKCTANIPVEYQLGRTDVVCEGYESPNDDYVLKGTFAIPPIWYRFL
jgi:store-operated calcium entry-associated regulatory factor